MPVLPPLVFLALWVYIAFGFLNGSVARDVSLVFNAPAKVGAVNTRWLKNLNVENISVAAPDNSTPLAIGAIGLDWDMGALLFHNRIRSAAIERPQLNLVRDTQGRWNLNLAPQNKEPVEYRVEQFLIHDGSVAVEWEPERKIHLQALSGSFTGNGPRAASPFNLRAELDSREPVAISGNIGPGESWNGRIIGAALLERDLVAVLGSNLGLKGNVKCDLSAANEMLPRPRGEGLTAKSSGRIAFSGHLGLSDFKWILNATPGFEWFLKVPANTLELQGSAGADPINLFTLSEFKYNAQGVGNLDGVCTLPLQPGVYFSVERGEGTLDMEGVDGIFQPRLLGPHLSLQGGLRFSNLVLSIPIGQNSPPFKIGAELAADDAHFSIPGFGALPACNAQGSLNWPALKVASFTVSDIAQAAFDLQDVYPPGAHFWSDFARGLSLHNLHVDLAHFCDSETGRRTLSGVLDEKTAAPGASTLPFAFEGSLNGSETKVAVASSPADGLALTLSALTLQDLKLRKFNSRPAWPRSRTLSGVLQTHATMTGEVPQRVDLNAVLSAPAPANYAGAPQVPGENGEIKAELGLSIIPDAHGNWTPGTLGIKRLAVPLSEFDEMLQYLTNGNLSGIGNLVATDAVIDVQSAKYSSAFELQNARLYVTLPRVIVALAVNVLKETKYSGLGPLVESIDKVCVATGVRLSVSGNNNEGRVSMRGRLQQINLQVPVPFIGNQTFISVPASDVVLEAGPDAGTLQLIWDANNKLSVTLAPLEHGQWHATGTLDLEDLGGVSFAFDVPFDTLKNEIGKSSLVLRQLDLQELTTALGLKDISASGMLKNIKCDVDALSFPLLPGHAVEARLSAAFEKAAISSPQTELEHLSGGLTSNFNYKAGDLNILTLLKLESYDALFKDDQVHIGNGSGSPGTIQIAAKCVQDAHVPALWRATGNATCSWLKEDEALFDVQADLGRKRLEKSSVSIKNAKLNTIKSWPDFIGQFK